MFQINPLKGFWKIKHLSCGATFEITGQKILDTKQPIKCSNCGIELCDTEMFRLGVKNFDMSLNDIERATKTINEPIKKVWEIDPPIKIIEEEESS